MLKNSIPYDEIHKNYRNITHLSAGGYGTIFTANDINNHEYK